ncbi:sigma 54-interacting transcriptional regulator [Cystobacter ferrugineus]|uniref:Fis family transcriptional regulator n=1 Tax=Cystobacter ferrugineus TaxID=83449 RepID=A0A1L9B3D6_9BACT|nr:sigma 54-interacting transcriptional regulator [Cystobacter ferrugineus]OJH36785.1 Fis family transcriptional regulator [Cystobacter ferrugineus]
MASLTIRLPQGKVRTVLLHKRITSIGRSADNDVTLEDPSVPDSALHVLFDGARYQLGSLGATFQVNGKKRDSAVLATSDVIRVGATELVFTREEAAPGPAPVPSPLLSLTHEAEPTADPDSTTREVPGVVGRELLLLRRLTAFSARVLGGGASRDTLLENLLDEAIEVTRADKGFLILRDNGELRVKVARNLSRENLEDAVERVSDSIIEKVVRTRQPLILSDALEDPEFKASKSVVNLQMLSVMCVPLVRDDELFGVLYVGNDRLVNRFEPKSLDMLTIFAAQALLLIHNALLVNDLKLDNTELRKRLDDTRYGEIVGACQGMLDVYKRIDKIAPTDISVLITGETGTGKELIARELHRHSPRAKGPFVTINCGAIPENLLESELFGHVRGAFTGAVNTKVGRFQAAIGGTLFLDEIGEMPLQLQVKLLRALQEKVVYKVGDHRGEPVDIRVVTATNRVLEDEVRKGTFREDLYYRLNVVTLKLPPLRERGEDLFVLGKYFLQKYAKEFGARTRGFSPSATVAMKKYGWPGNIRELENRIKKAVVLSDKPLIGPDDLDLKPENLEPVLPLAEARERWQKQYIQEVYERNNRNKTKTAKDLGVDPRTIFRHFEKLEADKSGEPSPSAGDGDEELL